ncbi:glucosamine-6-phosphate deaminase [Rhodobacterales bacterium 52_120_T64]|nr:glucosamine-6-phosphate deaminase [Rhodobacterales bacterium 52_120_T64]
MKVLIFDTAERAAECVAQQVIAQVQGKADSVLGLATGGTMLPIYELLVSANKNKQVSFSQASSFNLDEYVGLNPDHPCSYHKFMRDIFFSKTDFDVARAHLPHGNTGDPEAESEDYENLVLGAGGIDLQLLGIGENGHIGFNEPTSSFRSLTRIKTLTKSTIDANRRFFEAPAEPPKYAITMGIETILRGKMIAVLATGKNKSGAVATMVEGAMGAYCPATALQLHRHTTVVLDQAAASELKMRDYYFQVHPDGKDALV